MYIGAGWSSASHAHRGDEREEGAPHAVRLRPREDSTFRAAVRQIRRFQHQHLGWNPVQGMYAKNSLKRFMEICSVTSYLIIRDGRNVLNWFDSYILLIGKYFDILQKMTKRVYPLVHEAHYHIITYLSHGGFGTSIKNPSVSPTFHLRKCDIITFACDPITRKCD